MKLELRFSAKDGFLPLDYRPFIMSYFKGALSKTYTNVFNSLYNKNEIKSKSFTFSVYFDKAIIDKDRIILPTNKFKVTISSYDYATIMYFNNSLLLKCGKSMNVPLGTSIRLNSVNIAENSIIKSNEVKIKFLSPLLVRDRVDNHDIYLDYTALDFNKKLNIVVSNFIDTLPNFYGDRNIFLTPINAKRTVVKNMKLKFNASYGEFLLKGNVELLNYLLESGIGSRRGEGFGMFMVIDNEK
ncbi:MAG: CRISPR-associated endoribonuclease Cas6 [Clostridia bacterium]|nr:CRISPR-associated endoribonuclease Cas6 [Clostridia bacterium]